MGLHNELVMNSKQNFNISGQFPKCLFGEAKG